jgi:HAD superfamily hydrolase (TIGR01490 family)
MDLALFDLDNTLLDGDSDYEWSQFLISQGALDRETYEALNAVFYQQYKDGTLNIKEFLDFQLRPLTLYSREQLEQFHAGFMKTRITSMIREKGIEEVNKHQQAGNWTAIVTATNSFITRPIAHRLGISELIATEPEVIDGTFSGRIQGTPCFREGKIVRVQEWMRQKGVSWNSFKRIYFYSDSLNDLPLLCKVTNPVAVNPDPTLEAHARQNSWPTVSFAKMVAQQMAQ